MKCVIWQRLIKIAYYLLPEKMGLVNKGIMIKIFKNLLVLLKLICLKLLFYENYFIKFVVIKVVVIKVVIKVKLFL